MKCYIVIGNSTDKILKKKILRSAHCENDDTFQIQSGGRIMDMCR